MTPDDIIEMARQAAAVNGTIVSVGFDGEYLEAFAKLVDDKATVREREAWSKVCEDIRKVFNEKADLAYVAGQKEEREACAKVCEDIERKATKQSVMVGQGCQACATAIRARGEA
jgi:hypothetical protein